MSVNIARQIIADIFPIAGTPVYNFTITFCIIRRLCIYRARCDEYHAPQFYKLYHLYAFCFVEFVHLFRFGFSNFAFDICYYHVGHHKNMRQLQWRISEQLNTLLSLLSPIKRPPIGGLVLLIH